MQKEFVQHPFQPVYDKHSQILILGSFPSIVSRKQQFYYMNPKNRFWKILDALFHTSFYESTGIQAYLYNGSYFPLGVNTDTEFSGGEITGKKTDSGSKYSNWKTATTSFFSDSSNSSEILKNNRNIYYLFEWKNSLSKLFKIFS